MNGPEHTDCARCEQDAPEFALGVLCGRDRAEMLLHLQQCPSCQDRVAGLSTTVTRLLELVPEAQPPPAFEHRVLAAITLATSPPSAPAPAPANVAHWAPHRRRVSLAVLIAACALLLAAVLPAADQARPPVPPDRPSAAPSPQSADVMVASLISDDDDQSPPPSVGPAGPRSGQKTGRDIGQAWIHLTRPSWVYVSITDPDLDTADHPTHGAGVTTDESVTCTLVQKDGVAIPLGSFSLRNGHADWSAPTPIDEQSLAQAQLTIAHGYTLARASFTTPITSQPGGGHTNTPAQTQDHYTNKDNKSTSKDKNPDHDNDKKNSQDKDQPSRTHDTKDQAGADLKDKIPTIPLPSGKHNDKNQPERPESRPQTNNQHHNQHRHAHHNLPLVGHHHDGQQSQRNDHHQGPLKLHISP